MPTSPRSSGAINSSTWSRARHQRPWLEPQWRPHLSTLNGRVDFNKVEATYSRMQPLFERLSLLVAAHGQYAANPLLSPELWAAMAAARSGARSIRQRSSLMNAINVLASCARPPPQRQQLTQAQLYAFADRGWLHNMAQPRNACEPRCGVGRRRHSLRLAAGVRALNGGFSTDLSVAKGIDGRAMTGGSFFIVTGRL